MKLSILLGTLALASIAQATTYSVKGTEKLDASNLTPAGQVLVKTNTVSAGVTVKTLGPAQLVYKGSSQNEVCDEYAPSPNGEPELAPCIKSHILYAPLLQIEIPVQLEAYVEDVKLSKQVTLTGGLFRDCIQDYDSFVTLKEPTAPPARVNVNATCEIFLTSPYMKLQGKSVPLGGADIYANSQFILRSSLSSSRLISVENGKVSAETAKDVAALVEKNTKTGEGSYVVIETVVQGKGGQKLSLFDYVLEIFMK